MEPGSGCYTCPASGRQKAIPLFCITSSNMTFSLCQKEYFFCKWWPSPQSPHLRIYISFLSTTTQTIEVPQNKSTSVKVVFIIFTTFLLSELLWSLKLKSAFFDIFFYIGHIIMGPNEVQEEWINKVTAKSTLNLILKEKNSKVDLDSCAMNATVSKCGIRRNIHG